jgi:hypothetical protein
MRSSELILQMRSYYPPFALKAFDGFKTCGVIRHGIMRLKCRSCDYNQIVALSCKKRGFCTSCANKFMLETSRHLVDNILPTAKYRQIVVTLPYDIRFIVGTNSTILGRLNKIITRAIHRVLKSKAIIKGLTNPVVGSINFIQRFGGMANLNPHWHCLVMEKAYEDRTKILERNLSPMDKNDLGEILHEIIYYTAKYFKNAGYIDEAAKMTLLPPLDEILQGHDSLVQDLADSMKMPKDDDASDHSSAPSENSGRGKLCLAQNGFTIHGATKINALDRSGLEKLINYMARPALSSKSIELQNDIVIYKLKRPLKSGTTQIKMPLNKFIKRLAALVPLPRRHLTRHHGIFARAHPLRPKIIKKPGVLKTLSGKLPDSISGQKLVANTTWCILLKRTFKIDLSICPICGDQIEVMAVIFDTHQIDRFMDWIADQSIGPPKS